MLATLALVSLATFMLANRVTAIPAVLQTRESIGPQLANIDFYTSCTTMTTITHSPQQVTNNTYTTCHNDAFQGIAVHDMDSNNGGVMNTCKVDVWKTQNCQDGGFPSNFLGGFQWHAPVDKCVPTINATSWKLDCPFPVIDT